MRITSSSTSSSEAALAPAWRGFAATLVAAAAGACLAALAFLVVLDPYDTGRLFSIDRPGVAPQGPRTANASRGRDPAFDSAIIGNSRVQLLSPERLSAATGLRFVSLTVPGTYPSEQLAVLDWFLQHHPTPRAIVIGLDDGWCREDADYRRHPFPFWLYGRSNLAYFTGLLNFSALEATAGRIAVLRDAAKTARRDGYWDYETDYLTIGHGGPDRVLARLAGQRPTQGLIPKRFGAAEALRSTLAIITPQTHVLLVHPPRYISSIPKPGSAADLQDAACRAEYRKLAGTYHNIIIIDWSGDRQENRAHEYFLDETHYRRPLADAIEANIIASISRRNTIP